MYQIGQFETVVIVHGSLSFQLRTEMHYIHLRASSL